MDTPAVSVGIMTEKALSFRFNGIYVHRETSSFLDGEQRAALVGDNILFNGKRYKKLFFEPVGEAATFDLMAVTIGKEYHWERREDQRFQGALELLALPNGIVVINEVDVEDYLVSVISSEMSASSDKEFLKAHAVISRSWLFAQMHKNTRLKEKNETYLNCVQDKDRFIRWYDRQDHDLFDVCADDHCQRYQGVSRATTRAVTDAVRETIGEVLMSGENICDTRFSKCCGGVTELFETCWEPAHHSYLSAVRDAPEGTTFPNLTNEQEAEQWIRTAPDAFCNTTDKDKDVLKQVLNNYDQETADFFRWRVEYTQEELVLLLNRNPQQIDFGLILDLIPIKRGPSGRIEELKVVGSNQTVVLGKELEIRRALSSSHLYSSAFVVDKLDVLGNVPGRFVLTGAGWGHGVGLCQIGAAMMSEQGYGYTQILEHYYRGASVVKYY